MSEDDDYTYNYSHEVLIMDLLNLATTEESNIPGLKICRYYFDKHIKNTKGNKGITFNEFLANKNGVLEKSYIQSVVFYQVHNNRKINLKSAYELYYGAINIFRPSIAKSLYRECQATRVLDPFAGWGSRLLAAASLNIDYIGIDSNINLKESYQSLISFLMDTGVKSDITMYFKDSSKVNYSSLPSYDMVLTSPPYYRPGKGLVEGYENMPEYISYNFFIADLIFPVFNQCWKNLKKNGWLVINVPEYMYSDLTTILGSATKIIPLKKYQNHRSYKEYIYFWYKT